MSSRAKIVELLNKAGLEEDSFYLFRSSITWGSKTFAGNCFAASGIFLLLYATEMDEESRLVLCHGIPTNTDTGERYGHAWVEVQKKNLADWWMTVAVLDPSFGDGPHPFEVPAGLYYRKGKIDQEEVVTYDLDQSIKLLENKDHWGPWDESFDDSSIVWTEFSGKWS